MALDLEEQEQLANLKNWWKDYGKWLAILVAVLFLGYFAYRSYGNYQVKVSGEAADVYQGLILSASSKDVPKVIQVAQELQTKFGATAYASMGSLVAANLANAVGNREETLKQLTWVEEKSAYEGLQSIARNRLITLLLDSGDDSSMSKAEALLKKSPAPGFEALQLERKGDWYLVKNQPKEALAAYKEAWEVSSKQKAKNFGQKELDPILKEMEKRNPDETQRLLKVKIDSLGGF